GGLGGVAVEQRAAGAGQGGEVGDGLQDAGLVVGGHHRHQHGLVGEGGLQGGGVEAAVGVHRQRRHPYTVQAPQGAAGFQHGRVFGGLGDHVRARPVGGQHRAAQGQQVRLGAGGGEDHLGRAGPDQGGDLGAGRRERRTGSLSVVV